MTRFCLVLAAIIIFIRLQNTYCNSEKISLQAAGATFPSTLYRAAISSYLSTLEEMTNGIEVNYTPTGSGKGKCRIKSWSETCEDSDTIEPHYIDFAGSDSILNEFEYEAYDDLQMYPTVAGAVVPVYNLPFMEGKDSLILTMSTLAGIFSANITEWSDPQIVAENLHMKEQLQNLTDPAIKVCVRKDKSGTTEIWTSALSSADTNFNKVIGTSSLPSWNGGPYYRQKGSGIAAFVSQTEKSIGYLVLGDAKDSELSIALLKRGDEIITASTSSMLYAVSELGMSFGNNGDDPIHLTADLYDAKGDLAWPIVGYTYLVMRTDTLREGATCQHRYETVKFWTWFYTSPIAEEIISYFGFTSLPTPARNYVLQRLHSDIYCNGNLVYKEESQTTLYFSLPTFIKNHFEYLIQGTYGTYSGNTFFMFNTTDEAHDGMDTLENGIDLLMAHEEHDYHDEYHEDYFVAALTACNLVFIYNVCGGNGSFCEKMDTLALDGKLISDILMGRINQWDDPDITALNPDFVTINEPITFVAKNDNAYLEILDEHFLATDEFDPEQVVKDRVAESEIEIILDIIENPYTLGFVPLTPSIPATTTISNVLRSDGSVTTPSISSTKACAEDTYDREENRFNLDSSLNTTCYPISRQYVISAKMHYYEDDCIDSKSKGHVVAFFLEWLLHRGTFDKSLEAALYTPIFSMSDEVYSIVKRDLLKITCNGKSILDPDANYNYVSAWATPLSWTFSGLVAVIGISLVVWVHKFRTHKVIRNAQPEFLCLLIVGATVMTFSLIPFSLDDTGVEYESLDGNLDLEIPTPHLDCACDSLPWIYLTGFSLEFSALFVKIWRLKKIMLCESFKRVRVRFKDAFPIVGGSLCIVWILCSILSLTSPLHWQRVATTFNSDGKMIESYGHCRSNTFGYFLFFMFCIQFCGLLYGIHLSYKTRNVKEDFVENKWVTIVLLNIASVLMLTMMLGFFMYRQPAAMFAIAFTNIFMNGLCVVLLIMVPKIWFVMQLKAHFQLIVQTPSPSPAEYNGRGHVGTAGTIDNSQTIDGSHLDGSGPKRHIHLTNSNVHLCIPSEPSPNKMSSSLAVDSASTV